MKRRFVEALTLGIPVILIANIIPNAENVTAKKRKVVSSEVEEMTSDDKEYALGRIIVRYKDGVSEETINTSIERKSALGVKTLKKVEGQNQYRSIFLSEGDIKEINGSSRYTNLDQNALEDRKNELRSTLESYLLDPNVEYAQPVYIYRHQAWSSSSDMDYPQDFDWNGGDPEDGNHWYYDKENVMQMWQDQECDTGGANCGGSSTVTVAVVDSGLAVENRTSNYKGESTQFDYDIAPEFNTASGFNRYNNSDETDCTDGDDDDSNGYIDDCHGYNAYEDWYCDAYGCTTAQSTEEGHPNDDYGHGTYVTGLIASNIDNAGTSVSPAHNVTIMPIKASERITHADYPGTYGPAFYSDDLCNALDYARLNGADVINMSLGGDANDPLFKSCIDDAYNAGITLIAASGNDNSSIDYPAYYSTVIAVGASNKNDEKASYSNYGSRLSLSAAVGTKAYQQSYACFSSQSCHSNVATNFKSFNIFQGGGTSYASPQVAAAAALILTKNSSATPHEIKETLNGTAIDINGGGYDQQLGYGIIDYEALWNYTWSSWNYGGRTISSPALEVFSVDNKLYQIKHGLDNSFKTRSSADGDSWSSWSQAGKTSSSGAMTEFNGKLYQAKQGTENVLKIRSSADGSSWSSWVKLGRTLESPEIAVSNNKLFAAKRGLDNSLKVRYTNDGSSWSNWYTMGKVASKPALVDFNNKLFIARQGTGNYLKIRNTADGNSWSSWLSLNRVSEDPDMEVFGGNLYLSKKGIAGTFKVGYSADGTTWNNWSEEGGGLYSPVLKTVGSKLYLSKTGSSHSIKIKYTTDGTTWSTWISNEYAYSTPALIQFNSTLFVAAEEENSTVYSHYLL